jgi:hypothetical protein
MSTQSDLEDLPKAFSSYAHVPAPQQALLGSVLHKSREHVTGTLRAGFSVRGSWIVAAAATGESCHWLWAPLQPQL